SPTIARDPAEAPARGTFAQSPQPHQTTRPEQGCDPRRPADRSAGARYERLVPAFGELDQIDAVAERVGEVGHPPVTVIDDVAVQNTTCSHSAGDGRLEAVDNEVKVHGRPVTDVVPPERRRAGTELRFGPREQMDRDARSRELYPVRREPSQL